MVWVGVEACTLKHKQKADITMTTETIWVRGQHS